MSSDPPVNSYLHLFNEPVKAYEFSTLIERFKLAMCKSDNPDYALGLYKLLVIRYKKEFEEAYDNFDEQTWGSFQGSNINAILEERVKEDESKKLSTKKPSPT